MAHAPVDNLNPAWVATQAAKEVQGVATYLEFSGHDGASVIQIIITPDTIASNGRLVPATFFRRQITTNTPRKQWKHSSLTSVANRAEYYFPKDETQKQIVVNFQETGAMSEVNSKYNALARMEPFYAYFKQIGNRGFKLVKEMPLHAEISKQDVDSIAMDKLPTKLMYRINQLRLVNGFPDPILKS